jgi:hypothetical protein
MLAATYTQLNQYQKDNFNPALAGKLKELTFTNNSIRHRYNVSFSVMIYQRS